MIKVSLPWLQVTFLAARPPARTRLPAMGENPRIAVTIPSWNGLDDLQRCLDPSRAQRGVELELFVVNNGSEDGTGEFLERSGIPHLSLPRNLGFAAAINLGVTHTSADSVLVLNEDAELEPDCLQRLHASLQADPTLGGVQPLMLQLQRELPASPEGPEGVRLQPRAIADQGREGAEDGAGLPRGESPIGRREIFGVCGAACLLRREMLEGLGGYDEHYFAFYEDVDLNVRARIAGWRFLLDPEAVAWHVGQAAWRAGFRRPGRRQRTAGGAQQHRHPDQVHVGALVPRISLSRSAPSCAPPSRAACSRPSPASWRFFAGCRICSGPERTCVQRPSGEGAGLARGRVGAGSSRAAAGRQAADDSEAIAGQAQRPLSRPAATAPLPHVLARARRSRPEPGGMLSRP